MAFCILSVGSHVGLHVHGFFLYSGEISVVCEDIGCVYGVDNTVAVNICCLPLSVVKGRYPNNCAIGGNPARLIRKNVIWDNNYTDGMLEECPEEYILPTMDPE